MTKVACQNGVPNVSRFEIYLERTNCGTTFWHNTLVSKVSDVLLDPCPSHPISRTPRLAGEQPLQRHLRAGEGRQLGQLGVGEARLPKEKQQGKIHYQVLILPYVCRIVGGEEKHDDLEVLETRWFNLDEALNQNHLLGTKEIYKALLPELKQIVKEKNL